MNRKRPHFITLGPSIPVVPVKHFTKFRTLGLTTVHFENAWEIIGPSVEQNLKKGELWEVITAAYLEGLHHGSALTLKQIAKEREGLMIRICPKRDAPCPHGMKCPYVIDRYTCEQEPGISKPELKTTERTKDAT